MTEVVTPATDPSVTESIESTESIDQSDADEVDSTKTTTERTAGAITQRVRLGHYGIGLGQLELEPIPEVSERFCGRGERRHRGG